MKKLLIASAALAMVAGTAQAQSSVTVYGSYDMGHQVTELENAAGVNTAAKVKSSGIAGSALTSNRIGFRGTEDLGGGLKANFNLEYGFANTQSGDAVTTTEPSSPSAWAAGVDGASSGGKGGALTTRTSRVGLESAKLGRLDIGYGLTGLFATVTGHSPLPGNNFIGDLAYSNATAASAADSRILVDSVRANGIQYTSPTMNGLQVVVDAGSNSEKRSGAADATGEDSRAQNTGFTLRYNVGALALAGTVASLKHDYSKTSNDITTRDYQALSARYNVNSSLILNALYAKNETKGQAGTQTGKNDVTQVGVTYIMGKTSLVAQYGKGEGETTPGAERRDREAYQLGAIYNLSKRTNVYAVYGNQEGKYVTSSTSTKVGVTEKISGYSVGVRHSF
jgi:predicted porin